MTKAEALFSKKKCTSTSSPNSKQEGSVCVKFQQIICAMRSMQLCKQADAMDSKSKY